MVAKAIRSGKGLEVCYHSSFSLTVLEKQIFSFFLLKATVPSETVEGLDVFKLLEAATIVYKSYTDALARGTARFSRE